MGLTRKENLEKICCRVFEIRAFLWKLKQPNWWFSSNNDGIYQGSRSPEDRRYRKWLEFRDFYTKGRGTDCKAAVRALTGVTIVLLVIETHHLKEEEERDTSRPKLNRNDQIRDLQLVCGFFQKLHELAAVVMGLLESVERRNRDEGGGQSFSRQYRDSASVAGAFSPFIQVF